MDGRSAHDWHGQSSAGDAGKRFCLSWLGVALWNPADVFDTSCQLSFIAVSVLMRGGYVWEPRQPEPLEEVIAESRSNLEAFLLAAGRMIAVLFAVNLAAWVAVSPLAAARFHVVTPVALLGGPWMVVVRAIALVLGFLFLFSAVLGGPLTWILAFLTDRCLMAGEAITSFSVQLPFAYAFVPDIPSWRLWAHYVCIMSLLLLPSGLSLFSKRSVAALLAALSLTLAFFPWRDPAFRCTFLAVGHGGCVVVESPQGHVLVYDAGAITGPEVTRQCIAPYLWSRGIRSIDELLISHGDLDHYNGVPALLERFKVRRVGLTPSFAERRTPGVGHTLRVFERMGLEPHVIKAGDRWTVGGVSFEALHPPPVAAGGERKRPQHGA